MGCPKCETVFKSRDEAMEFNEVIESGGRPRMIDFAKKNRRVLKVLTYDREMDFTWTERNVFINGPRGTAVTVTFVIA